jgi:hypothetical protein
MKCKRLSLRAYVQLPQHVSDELLYVLIATVVQGDARALSVRQWCGGLDPMGTPSAIVELARLALKAKSETARIAAIRELLDRGYGQPRQAVEVSAPAGDPIQELFDEIDALNRKRIYKQVPNEPA